MKGSGPAFRSVVARIAGFRDTAATALSFDGSQISYAELHLRSEKFAQHLARLGVVGECTVALCMERSFDWIIAALGILRAGAAYVPLDAGWPEFRLKFATDNSKPGFWSPVLPSLIAWGSGFRESILFGTGRLSRLPRRRLNRSISLRSMPTVLPTLSTLPVRAAGRRGVEITHGNLVISSTGIRRPSELRPGYRTSHLAGLGFDASAWELWPNLSAGATICLADEASRSSAERTRQWMLANGLQSDSFRLFTRRQ